MFWLWLLLVALFAIAWLWYLVSPFFERWEEPDPECACVVDTRPEPERPREMGRVMAANPGVAKAAPRRAPPRPPRIDRREIKS
jgi:hypothetical protein